MEADDAVALPSSPTPVFLDASGLEVASPVAVHFLTTLSNRSGTYRRVVSVTMRWHFLLQVLLFDGAEFALSCGAIVAVCSVIHGTKPAPPQYLTGPCYAPSPINDHKAFRPKVVEVRCIQL